MRAKILEPRSPADLHHVDVPGAEPLELAEVEGEGLADAPSGPHLSLAGGIG